MASDLYMGGKTVIIDHGLGVFSTYGHMSKLLVEAGRGREERTDDRALRLDRPVDRPSSSLVHQNIIRPHRPRRHAPPTSFSPKNGDVFVPRTGREQFRLRPVYH